MRIFFFVATIHVLRVAGTGQSSSDNASERSLAISQRDAIVKSTFLAHPDWTSDSVMDAVKPLILTAGLPPITMRALRAQMHVISKEYNFKRVRSSLDPKYTAYLKGEFAKDRSQSTDTVWANFRAIWGPGIEEADRVKRWWRQAHRNRRCKLARWRAKGAQSPQSDPDLPADWWDLGDELNQYLFSDSSSSGGASGSNPPGPSAPLLVAPPQPNEFLSRRNSIVESIYLANPRWTIPQVHAAATPLILAAGFDPVGLSTIGRIMRRTAKTHRLKSTPGGMSSEHAAFLKARFAKDPNKPARDIWTKFVAAFGPTAESEERILSWWSNCRNRSLKKQLSAAAAAGRRGSPKSPTRSATPQSSTSRARSPSRLPLDCWDPGMRDLGKDLDDVLGSGYALDGSGANYLLDH